MHMRGTHRGGVGGSGGGTKACALYTACVRWRWRRSFCCCLQPASSCLLGTLAFSSGPLPPADVCCRAFSFGLLGMHRAITADIISSGRGAGGCTLQVLGGLRARR